MTKENIYALAIVVFIALLITLPFFIAIKNVYYICNGKLVKDIKKCNINLYFTYPNEEKTITFFIFRPIKNCQLNISDYGLKNEILIDVNKNRIYDLKLKEYIIIDNFENGLRWSLGNLSENAIEGNNSLKVIFNKPWQISCKKININFSNYANYFIGFWSKTNNSKNNYARIELRGKNCREVFQKKYSGEGWQYFYFQINKPTTIVKKCNDSKISEICFYHKPNRTDIHYYDELKIFKKYVTIDVTDKIKKLFWKTNKIELKFKAKEQGILKVNLSCI